MNDMETVKFLIVDDDAVSVMSIKRTLKKLRLVNPVRVAADGVEALEILRGDAGQDRILPPYVVTLDLNMPRMNGHEFLDEIRQDPRLSNAVVFVFSTSDAPNDVADAYERNVAGYLVKENAETALPEALEMLGAYSRLVLLPQDRFAA
jgi:CheY-like chemotaxis protein